MYMLYSPNIGIVLCRVSQNSRTEPSNCVVAHTGNFDLTNVPLTWKSSWTPFVIFAAKFTQWICSKVLTQCLQRWFRADIASIIHRRLHIYLSFSSLSSDRQFNRTRWWLSGLRGSCYWSFEHISLGDGWRATFHSWWTNHFKIREKSFH